MTRGISFSSLQPFPDDVKLDDGVDEALAELTKRFDAEQELEQSGGTAGMLTAPFDTSISPEVRSQLDRIQAQPVDWWEFRPSEHKGPKNIEREHLLRKGFSDSDGPDLDSVRTRIVENQIFMELAAESPEFLTQKPEARWQQLQERYDAYGLTEAGVLAPDPSKLPGEAEGIGGIGDVGESLGRQLSTGSVIPVIGDVLEFGQMFDAMTAIEHIEAGTATESDLFVLSEVQEEMIRQMRGQTWLGMASDIGGAMVPLVAEFALSMGLYSVGKGAAKTAGKAAGRKAIEKMLSNKTGKSLAKALLKAPKSKAAQAVLRSQATKTAAKVGSYLGNSLGLGAVAAGTVFVPNVATEVLQRTMPTVSGFFDGEEGKTELIVTDDGQDFKTALASAYTGKVIEIFAETTGQPLMFITKGLGRAGLRAATKLRPHRGPLALGTRPFSRRPPPGLASRAVRATEQKLSAVARGIEAAARKQVIGTLSLDDMMRNMALFHGVIPEVGEEYITEAGKWAAEKLSDDRLEMYPHLIEFDEAMAMAAAFTAFRAVPLGAAYMTNRADMAAAQRLIEQGPDSWAAVSEGGNSAMRAALHTPPLVMNAMKRDMLGALRFMRKPSRRNLYDWMPESRRAAQISGRAGEEDPITPEDRERIADIVRTSLGILSPAGDPDNRLAASLGMPGFNRSSPLQLDVVRSVRDALKSHDLEPTLETRRRYTRTVDELEAVFGLGVHESASEIDSKTIRQRYIADLTRLLETAEVQRQAPKPKRKTKKTAAPAQAATPEDAPELGRTQEGEGLTEEQQNLNPLTPKRVAGAVQRMDRDSLDFGAAFWFDSNAKHLDYPAVALASAVAHFETGNENFVDDANKRFKQAINGYVATGLLNQAEEAIEVWKTYDEKAATTYEAKANIRKSVPKASRERADETKAAEDAGQDVFTEGAKVIIRPDPTKKATRKGVIVSVEDDGNFQVRSGKSLLRVSREQLRPDQSKRKAARKGIGQLEDELVGLIQRLRTQGFLQSPAETIPERTHEESQEGLLDRDLFSPPYLFDGKGEADAIRESLPKRLRHLVRDKSQLPEGQIHHDEFAEELAEHVGREFGMDLQTFILNEINAIDVRNVADEGRAKSSRGQLARAIDLLIKDYEENSQNPYSPYTSQDAANILAYRILNTDSFDQRPASSLQVGDAITIMGVEYIVSSVGEEIELVDGMGEPVLAFKPSSDVTHDEGSYVRSAVTEKDVDTKRRTLRAREAAERNLELLSTFDFDKEPEGVAIISDEAGQRFDLRKSGDEFEMFLSDFNGENVRGPWAFPSVEEAVDSASGLPTESQPIPLGNDTYFVDIGASSNPAIAIDQSTPFDDAFEGEGADLLGEEVQEPPKEAGASGDQEFLSDDLAQRAKGSAAEAKQDERDKKEGQGNIFRQDEDLPERETKKKPPKDDTDDGGSGPTFFDAPLKDFGKDPERQTPPTTGSVGAPLVAPFHPAAGSTMHPEGGPDPRPQSEPEKKLRPTNKKRIMESLSDVLLAFRQNASQQIADRVRTGLFGRKVMGYFISPYEVTRVRDALDFSTGAHEVGHAIETLVWGNAFANKKNKAFLSAVKSAGARKELIQLGKDLYGSRKPVGGYQREGFAEFTRMWIESRDEARQKAPNFAEYFESVVLRNHPDGRRALDKAARLVKQWNAMTAAQQVEASRVDVTSPKERAAKAKRWLQYAALPWIKRQWFESFVPLQQFMQTAYLRSSEVGRPLKLQDSDIYEIASAFRGSSQGIVESWFTRGITDLAGNLRGIQPLNAVSSFVKGQEQMNDWLTYLHANRALAIWQPSKKFPHGRDPGITQQQAEATIQELGVKYNDMDLSQFAQAADIFYRWNEGVLDYAAQASPTFALIVSRIRQTDPGRYLPLAREMDRITDAYHTIQKARPGSEESVLKRLKGSNRRVVNPLETTINNAVNLVAAAQQSVVMDTAIRISEAVPGLGKFISRIPRKQELALTKDVDSIITKLRKELAPAANKDPAAEQLVDMLEEMQFSLDPDTLTRLISFFVPATRPQNDPDGMARAAFVVNNELRFYEFDPAFFDAIRSTAPENQLFAGHWLVNLLAKTPATLVRLGNTAYRASFGLVTNPVRDVQTLLINSQAQGNAFQLFTGWMRGMADGLVGSLPGHRDRAPVWELYARTGSVISQVRLGSDPADTKRLTRRIAGFHVRDLWSPTAAPRTMRAMAGKALEAYVDIINFPETASRVAEMSLIAKDVGWDTSQPVTFTQMVKIINAGKRATVDFTAAGDFSRAVNQVVPFFNATLQGARLFARNLFTGPPANRMRSLMRGLSAFTAPTMLLWWFNRDKQWYKELTDDERSLYWHIEMGDELLRIPRAFEFGMLFAAIPERMADLAYRQDPESMERFFGSTFGIGTPFQFTSQALLGQSPMEAAKSLVQQVTPTVFLTPGQLLANEKLFTSTPIVSRSLEGRPRTEQYDEFTSRFAIGLAEILDRSGIPLVEEFNSPKQIDFAIKETFGGVSTDLLNLLGYGPQEILTEPQWSQKPLINRIVSRRPKTSSRTVDRMYRTLGELQTARRSDKAKETPLQREQRLMLEGAARNWQLARDMAFFTPSVSQSEQIQDEALADVIDAMAHYDKGETRAKRNKRLANLSEEGVQLQKWKQEGISGKKDLRDKHKQWWRDKGRNVFRSDNPLRLSPGYMKSRSRLNNAMEHFGDELTID